MSAKLAAFNFKTVSKLNLTNLSRIIAQRLLAIILAGMHLHTHSDADTSSFGPKLVHTQNFATIRGFLLPNPFCRNCADWMDMDAIKQKFDKLLIVHYGTVMKAFYSFCIRIVCFNYAFVQLSGLRFNINSWISSSLSPTPTISTMEINFFFHHFRYVCISNGAPHTHTHTHNSSWKWLVF